MVLCSLSEKFHRFKNSMMTFSTNSWTLERYSYQVVCTLYPLEVGESVGYVFRMARAIRTAKNRPEFELSGKIKTHFLSRQSAPNFSGLKIGPGSTSSIYFLRGKQCDLQTRHVVTKILAEILSLA